MQLDPANGDFRKSVGDDQHVFRSSWHASLKERSESGNPWLIDSLIRKMCVLIDNRIGDPSRSVVCLDYDLGRGQHADSIERSVNVDQLRDFCGVVLGVDMQYRRVFDELLAQRLQLGLFPCPPLFPCLTLLAQP